jgi:hypothetical protein
MCDWTSRWIVAGLLAVSVSSGALAQQSPPPPSPVVPAHNPPRPEDLEPGVNTSAAPPPDSASPGTVTPPSTAPVAPKVGKPAASAKSAVSAKPSATGSEGASAASASTAGKPAAGAAPTGKPAAGTSASTPGPNSGTRGKEDRLQLDTTEITGNQELPKVLYIVPWKRADLGDLLGKPANSLLDEVLQPVDRDVFKRENRYYDALKPDASGGTDKAAGAAGQGSGDKR